MKYIIREIGADYPIETCVSREDAEDALSQHVRELKDDGIDAREYLEIVEQI